MPSTKTTTSETSTTASGAKKLLTEVPKFGAKTAYSAFSKGLEQGQRLALNTAERVAGTVNKAIPSALEPAINRTRGLVIANIDFALSLAKSNAEFASKFAKTLVEAR